VRGQDPGDRPQLFPDQARGEGQEAQWCVQYKDVIGIPPVFSLHRQTPREEDNNYKGDVGVTVHKCDDIFSFTYIKFVIYLLI